MDDRRLDRVLLITIRPKDLLSSAVKLTCFREEQERKHLGASYHTYEADCIGNQ